MKTISLHLTNIEMPIVGLGTWQAKPEEIEISVVTAVEAGYRHIDTAFNYNNEEVIGKVLKTLFESGKIKREELFITTKLPHIGTRGEDVEKFLKLSLQKLNLDYIDLYLVHVPFGFHYNNNTLVPLVNDDGTYQLDMNTDHKTLWKAMESAMDKGYAKNIGLSNFNKSQIEYICKDCRIKPQVLQIECHAYLQQMDLIKFCKDNDITVVAYSPLGSPGAHKHFLSKYNFELKNCPDILGNPSVQEIAKAHNKSAAQIVLRHFIQKNIAVIPKSSNPNRINENINVFDFELNEDEVKILDELDKGEIYRIIKFEVWKGVENHPCYPFK